MAIASIAAAAAAKKALNKVIDDTYEVGKVKFGKQIKRWKAKSKIDKIYKKIKNVRKVKTIWQVEKEVDLLKFYHPSKVIIADKRKTINDLTEFGYDGNIVIKGTIGQGKSIFFRFLTSQEMLKGKAIPIFIELRRIKKDQTLSAHLLQELKSIGLDMDEETFLFLSKAGKIILFLDGFDEIGETQRTDLITEIEYFAKSYDSLKILVSSRPNSGIEVSPFFRVFELCALEGNEYEQVIGKMAYDERTASNIIKGVRSAKGKIAELLTTPLMVALLMLRYRVDQSIPENATAFYGDLFNLLLLRHDKTKAGYVRRRKSAVGDSALLEIFNGICFLTRKENQGAFMLSELHNYVKEAIKIADQKCSADKVAADIIEITCLIIEEVGECRFIHKSIQEYHAACFIKDRPEDCAAKFYEAMHSNWREWEQELEFLSGIDKYRFLKYFFIPDTLKTLALEYNTVSSQWKPSSRDIANLIDDIRIGFTKLPSPRLAHVSSPWRDQNWSLWIIARGQFVNKIFALDYSSVTKLIRQKSSDLAKKVEKTDIDLEIKAMHIVESGVMTGQIYEAADMALRHVHKELLSAKKYIKHIEATKSIFDF